MSRSPDAIYARRRHRSAEAAYSREPRRVELREQLRRPLATIAKNKVVGEIVDEDPGRWSQSSAGREYKMKGNFLRAISGITRRELQACRRETFNTHNCVVCEPACHGGGRWHRY
jgi:hypothetical protein